MAVDTSQFRNGLKVEIDGDPYNMIFFQHVKPGKGGAFVRTKLRNLRTGRVIERTYRSGERLDEADVQDRRMSYLYQDSSGSCSWTARASSRCRSRSSAWARPRTT